MSKSKKTYQQPTVEEICIDSEGLPLLADSIIYVEIDNDDPPVNIEDQD